jgi:hypothetical protein
MFNTEATKIRKTSLGPRNTSGFDTQYYERKLIQQSFRQSFQLCKVKLFKKAKQGFFLKKLTLSG